MKFTHENNRRILVIDDTPSIHEDFRKILVPNESAKNDLRDMEAKLFGDAPRKSIVQHPGFELDSAFQGAEGLELVRKSLDDNSPYALAFVDIRMPPGWDGLETISRIWRAYPEMEVVICTAYSDYSWDDFFEKLGHSDQLLILKKPFDHIEVRQITHALTTKWKLAREAKAAMDDLNAKIEAKTSELKAAKRKVDAILNSVAEGICGTNEKDELTFINATVSRVTGYAPDDLLGRSLQAILPLSAEDRVPGTLRAGRVLTKTGATIPVEYLFNRTMDEGHLVGNVVAFHDVTEKKKLESKLLQAQKLEAIGQMAAGIAHEINNPLAYIAGNVSTLGDYVNYVSRIFPPSGKDGKLDLIRDDWRGLIAETGEGIGRVRDIINNLKSFARADENRTESADLNGVVESALKLASNELKYKCRVVRDYGDVPAVPCYPNQIAQVVVNLLVNAAQAIEKAGDVTVRTLREGDFAVLEVSDTGHGLKEEDLPKLFTPFFTTKPQGIGTGLGLSVSYGIVTNHGGDIEAMRAPDGGALFRVRLPLAGPRWRVSGNPPPSLI